MNELNNVDVNYFKTPQKHRGPQKMPSRAACLRPLSNVQRKLLTDPKIMSLSSWGPHI